MSPRRRIDFEELRRADLSAAERATLGRDWQRRMQQEYLAVGAFSLLATELAAVGCDDVVLSLVTRAACDEVAHADVCRRLADSFLDGKVVDRQAGLPNIPPHDDARPATRALLHVTEMCCIGETLTVCFFTDAIARTKVAAMREALLGLLEDEVDHARLGWAHLASIGRAERAEVAAAIPRMLERMVGWLPSAARNPGHGSERLEEYGYPMPSTIVEVYRRSLRDVVLGGFETIGVDLGPAHRYVRRSGMLEA
jgi:hypothetical protein